MCVHTGYVSQDQQVTSALVRWTVTDLDRRKVTAVVVQKQLNLRKWLRCKVNFTRLEDGKPSFFFPVVLCLLHVDVS